MMNIVSEIFITFYKKLLHIQTEIFITYLSGKKNIELNSMKKRIKKINSDDENIETK